MGVLPRSERRPSGTQLPSHTPGTKLELCQRSLGMGGIPPRNNASWPLRTSRRREARTTPDPGCTEKPARARCGTWKNRGAPSVSGQIKGS